MSQLQKLSVNSEPSIEFRDLQVDKYHHEWKDEPMSMPTNRGDYPIEGPEDDELGRDRPAELLAERLPRMDSSHGLAVGILGPWGSGKSSYVKLVRRHLEEAGIAVLDFNPWMFSGAEQLVQSFFSELAAQLKVRPGLQEVGDSLEEYGNLFAGLGWLPIFGTWIERGRKANNFIAKVLQSRSNGVSGPRDRIIAALAKWGKPIVVVIDDVDRLTTSEIRDIFRLVRLTANFPHVIYLVAFDRHRVEAALDETKVPGRDYLEKILQLIVDLPQIPQELLFSQIGKHIDLALEGIEETGPFNSSAWADIMIEIVWPLVRNMRDIRRYSLAISGTVSDLGGNIELVDVLGLEAIRIFLPDVFAEIAESTDVLTSTTPSTITSTSNSNEEKIDQLIAIGGAESDVVKNTILRLFPAAAHYVGGSNYGEEFKTDWLRKHRVAHETVLRLYLERVVSESFSSLERAEHAFTLLEDKQSLGDFFATIDPVRRQDVVTSLEIFQNDFSKAAAIPASTVFLNLIPTMPLRDQGMFDVGPRLAVSRVVLRLLWKLDAPLEVEGAVRQILDGLDSFTLKMQLINLVGFQDGVGSKLVSEAYASEIEADWLNSVRSATSEVLEVESDLLLVLLEAARLSSSKGEAFAVPDSPEFTLTLLRLARTNTKSQSLGNRAVAHSPRLFWDELIRVFGSEETLLSRVDQLIQADILEESDSELIDLARRYGTGARPSHFGEWVIPPQVNAEPTTNPQTTDPDTAETD